MSGQFDLIRAGYEAWNHDDLDAWLELVHPDAQLLTSGVFPDLEPVYRGHDGLAEFWREIHEPWETFRIDIEQLDELDDGFVMGLRFRGTGEDSGMQSDMRFANAIRLRDGLITEIVSRPTVDEARAALEATG